MAFGRETCALCCFGLLFLYYLGNTVNGLDVEMEILKAETAVDERDNYVVVRVQPQSNATCLLSYENQLCYTVLASDCLQASPDESAIFFGYHTFSSPGDYNVTVECVDSAETVARHAIIRVMEPVLGLQFENNTNSFVLSPGRGTVNFEYTNGTSLNVICSLYEGLSCDRVTHLNSTTPSGYVSFDAEIVPNTDSFPLNITLYNAVSSMVIMGTVIWGTKIQGLVLNAPKHVLINTSVAVTATIRNGSNVEYLWTSIGLSDASIWAICGGNNTGSSFSYNVSTYDQFYVEVAAMNKINEETATAVVYPLFPVENFTASLSSDLPGADIILGTSSSAVSKMGTLSVEVTDGGERLLLNTSLATIEQDAPIVLLRNISQGIHFLKIVVSSAVSSQSMEINWGTKIQGLVLNAPKHALINTAVAVTATIRNGSNVEYLWASIGLSDASIWAICDGNNTGSSFSYNVSTYDQFYVEVAAMNKINEETATAVVYPLFPVENFTASLSSDLPGADIILGTSSSAVSKMGTLSVEVTDGGERLLLNTSLATIEKDGPIVLLRNISQGIHFLKIVVSSAVSSQSMEINCGTKIQGLVLNAPKHVLINTAVTVTATIRNGSNVEYLWTSIVLSDASIWAICGGNNTGSSFSYNVSTYDQFYVEVAAMNKINEETATAVVYPLFPVENFTASLSSDLPGADIILGTSSSAVSKMGSLSVEVTDGGERLHLNTSLATIEQDAPIVLLRNISQGIHFLKIVVSSAVSSQSMEINWGTKIRGLVLNAPKHVLINTTLTVTATIRNGSNVEYLWASIGLSDASIWAICGGNNTGSSFSYNVSTYDQFYVEVAAMNKINEETATAVVYPLFPVENFTASLSSDLPGADIILGTSSSAVSKMGTLSVEVTDGGERLLLNTSLATIEQDVPIVLLRNISQGNHFPKIVVSSAVSSQSMEINASLWSPIDLDLETATSTVAVGETVMVNLLNSTGWGYRFNFSFGDNPGTPTEYVDETHLFHTETSYFTHQYLEEGVFHFRLVVSNDKYEELLSHTFFVLYPVPDFTFSPEPYFMIPPGKVMYTFQLPPGINTPTNATCTLFSNNLNDSKTSAFNYTWHEIMAEKEIGSLTDSGPYNLTLVCMNELGQQTHTSSTEARDLSVQQFTITCNDLVGFNDSASGVEVNYRIKFYDNSFMPDNVQLDWNFGDGSSPVRSSLTSWTVSHVFTERGEYNSSVVVTLLGESKEEKLAVQIGVLTVDKDLEFGEVNSDTITVLVTGARGETVNYAFDFGNGFTETCLQNGIGEMFVLTKEKEFSQAGTFPVRVLAYNEFFIEERDLGQVEMLLPVRGLFLPLEQDIPVPPGEGTVEISLDGSAPVPTNASCEVTYSDDSATDTITIPGLVSHSFVGLDEVIITAVCSNRISSVTLTNTTNLKSTCFRSDSPFAHVTDVLTKLVAEELTLSATIDNLCKTWTPQFTWNVSKDGEPEAIDQPNAAVLRLRPRQFRPGTYLVRFRATFREQPLMYVTDNVQVKCVASPLRAVIAGGSIRTIGLQQDVLIDALYLSSDPDVEKGNEQNLLFEWTCGKAETLSEIQLLMAGREPLSPCPVCLKESTEGVGTGSPGCLEEGYWHAVHVYLHKDSRNATAYQIINVVREPPSTVELRCKLNCLETKNTGEYFTLTSECSDCTKEELNEAVFSWTLFQRASPADPEVKVEGLAEKTSTGVGISSISIIPQSLDLGSSYRLELRVSNIPGKSTAVLSEMFYLNQPPYGGVCSVTPQSGRATLDVFTVTCSGWVDEGTNPWRSDSDTGDRLTYQFLLLGDKENSLIYSGSSGQSPPTELNVGDEKSDYELPITARVFDAFGAYTETTVTAKVTSPIVGQSNLTSTFDALEEFAEGLQGSLQTGDVQKSSRFIESATSAIHRVVLPEANTSLPEDADAWAGPIPVDVGGENHSAVEWGELWTDLTTPPDTRLQDQITQKTKTYVAALASIVNDTEDVSLDAAFAVSSSIAGLFEKPKYVNGDSLVTAAGTMGKIAGSLDAIQTDEMSDTQANEILEAVLTSVSNVVGATIPEHHVTDTELDVDSVRARVALQRGYLSDESILESERAKQDAYIHNDERVFLMSRTLLKQQYEAKEKQRVAKGVTESMLAVLDKTLDVAEKFLVIGQEPQVFSNPKMSASVEKVKTKDFLGRTTKRKGVSFTFDATQDLAGVVDLGASVVLEVTVFEKNPFIWDEDGTSASITSPSLVFHVSEDQHDENGLQKLGDVSVRQLISIRNPAPITMARLTTPDFDPQDRDKLIYHKVELGSVEDSIILFLSSPLSYVTYDAYFRAGEFPTATDYDYKTGIPPTHTAEGSALKMFCPGNTLPAAGSVYVGLRSTDLGTGKRQKRDISSANRSTDRSDYGFGVGTVGCKSWDSSASTWRTNRCSVSETSTENHTVCSCDRQLTEPFTLATSFVVPVNKIDFSTVFTKIDIGDNGSVLGTLLVLLGLYGLLAIWARHKDCSDFLKWGVTPVLDNVPGHSYFYIASVTTGMRPGAGTKSRVGLSLTGQEEESRTRLLYDGIRDEFPTRSVMNFLLAEPCPLGHLQYARVWHDDTGTGDYASWFLDNIVVEDLQTDTRYTFLCDRWLAVDRDDGKIERIIRVSGKDDLVAFSHLFNDNFRTNVTDSHLWLSVVLRPKQSHFTRLQRLSCCLSLLTLTMIANAMFYRAEDDIVRPSLVSVGSFKFSLHELYVSFISILIITPANILIVLLFKKTKPGSEKAQSLLDKKCSPRCWPGSLHRKKMAEVMITQRTYNPKDKMLPHYFLYVAWFILFASVALPAFFLISYSGQWGQSKSEEWLSSFLMSFVESVLIMDPIKVVIITVFLSIIFRKPTTEASSIDKGELGSQKQQTQQQRNFDTSHSSSPLGEEEVKRSQQKRRKESTAFSIFREIILYVIFLFVLFTLGYTNRDSRSFAIRTNIHNMMVKKQSDKRLSLENIRSLGQFFQWANETAFPALFAETYYEGSRRHWRDRQFLLDLQNYRVGPPRLRQVRVPPADNCRIPFFGKLPCKSEYSILSEESRLFCVGWAPEPCPPKEKLEKFSTGAWKFTSSLDIWGLPISGQYNTYSGGGYISQLEVNREVSDVILGEQYNHLWLDSQTRAVALEFTVYNPNVNIFVYVTFLVEFPETGGAIPSANVQPFRAYHHVGALGAYIIFNEVIFLMYVVGASIKLILSIRKQKRAFFRSIWNCMDVVCIITCYVSTGMFVSKELIVKQAIQKFNEDQKRFLNFQHVTVWDEVLTTVVGIICFFCTVRMIKILGYNHRVSSIMTVLRRASKDLASFSFVFGLVFTGFTILGYLLFGRELTPYYTLLTTAGTLFTSMIGKAPFDEMRRTEPVLAQIYFAVFVFLGVFILLTMFMSILNETISAVRCEDMADASRHQVIEILMEKFKESFGFLSTSSKADRKKEGVAHQVHSNASRVAQKKLESDTEFALKVLAMEAEAYPGYHQLQLDSDFSSVATSITTTTTSEP